MKTIILLLFSISLLSCTAEPIVQDITPIQVIKESPKKYTFTVKWDSNQEGSYVVFNKHVFKNCKVISTISETHREKQFDITLGAYQKFDIQIYHTSTQKYPELYLAIYKGSELQYEQEVDTNGFLLVSSTNQFGNIND